MPGHAEASTTEIDAHYAPDPAHGAAFAQPAFGDVAACRSGAERRVTAARAPTALVGWIARQARCS